MEQSKTTTAKAPHSTPTLTIPYLSFHFSTLFASHPIFPSVARHVLEKCVIIRHGISFLQSLAFFNWATVLLAFPSSPEPYHEMLDLAGKLRHFDLVWHIIDLMKSRDLPVIVHMFIALVRRYMRAGLAAEAVHTFNRMEEKAGKIEKVLQVYNQMKRFGCVVDTITCNFIIEIHCRDENLEEAVKFLNLMVKRGVAPNASTFNFIFGCIAKLHDVNGAHWMYARMKELKCQPNTLTYNILMRMFAESKSTDMVLKMKEMDENKVESCEEVEDEVATVGDEEEVNGSDEHVEADT
ncbi:hypothetical protein Fmac_015512 [Flemingia macrophylla]|uniref:Pentatricopeptide repeat-containing protein n=1 Tax=Flemingia macrophylla TaxID=520843 RepID=A0ABD1MES9_9FABA